MTPKILLVRHGETRWNEQGRVQGWAPVSLNDTGARQSKQLGSYLAAEHPDVEAIYSSDLERAVETTAEISEAGPFDDLPVSFDHELRERNFGVLQGLDSATLFSQYPEYAILDHGMEAARNEPELGESYVDFNRRIIEYWTDLAAKLAVQKALLVSHTGVIRQIIAHINGYDVVRALEEVELRNCCVTVVCLDADGGDLECENVTHFLG